MNTDFGIWNAEEDEIYEKANSSKIFTVQRYTGEINFDKITKKGDMKYYTKERISTDFGHWAYREADFSDVANDIVKSIGVDHANFDDMVFTVLDIIHAEEEKSEVTDPFVIPNMDSEEMTELGQLRKRVGELEAKAGKKRSFNALVIAHRDLMKKMNELLEAENE